MAKPLNTTLLQKNPELPRNHAIKNEAKPEKAQPPTMSAGSKPSVGYWPCPVGCVMILKSQNQGGALWFLAVLWYYLPESIEKK